jgi:hypothetical protein
VTPEQLALLWKMSDEPELCFDGDAAGRRAAWRTLDTALPILESGKSISFAMLPDGTDPDELLRGGDETAMDRVLRKAIPFVDVLWARESEGDWDTPEKRAGLEKRISDLVGEIKDEVLREHYRRDLRARFNVLVAEAVGRNRIAPGISFQGLDEFGNSFMEAIASDRTVFVCRDDESAAALKGLGVPAVAPLGGMTVWDPRHSIALKGADVVVVLGADSWAGTGPDGATCAMCEHYGRPRGSAAATYKAFPCEAFRRATGRPGAPVRPSTLACNRFVRLEK